MDGVILHFLKNIEDFTLLEAHEQQWIVSRWNSFMETPRPHWGFLLVLEGQVDYTWQGGGLTLTAGQLAFLPKGCCYDVHVRTDLGQTKSFILNFETPGQFAALPTCISRHGFLTADLFFKIGDTFEKEQYFAAKGHFLLLLQHLLEQKVRSNTTFEQATRLLEQELSMEEIARRCNLSQSSLRRLFARQTGDSPVQYRTKLKLQKACRLLSTTDQTVQQIAEETGFYDEAYFCKVFMKQMGLSPVRYRNKHQIIL